MRLFRIAKPSRAENPFDGEGARLYGGRWNPVGISVVYFSDSLALAALEKRVHMSPLALGLRWAAIEVEASDKLVRKLAPNLLPSNWDAFPALLETQAVGESWVRERQSLGLMVPSAIIPAEHNVLLNLAHPDFPKARHVCTTDFRFDPRLG